MNEIDPKRIHIVSEGDLYGILKGFVWQLDRIPRWRLFKRAKMQIAVNTMLAVIQFIKTGKTK